MNGVYWSFNLLTNLLLTSCDIQVAPLGVHNPVLDTALLPARLEDWRVPTPRGKKGYDTIAKTNSLHLKIWIVGILGFLLGPVVLACFQVAKL